MKCISSTTSPSSGAVEETAIAYAQWRLPLPLWEKVRAEHGGGIQVEVTREMKAEFEKEYAESCTPEGEPRGMRVEVVEACSPAMGAANRRCFPVKGKEYISASDPLRFSKTLFARLLTADKSRSARPSENSPSPPTPGRGHAAHALGHPACRS